MKCSLRFKGNQQELRKRIHGSFEKARASSAANQSSRDQIGRPNNAALGGLAATSAKPAARKIAPSSPNFHSAEAARVTAHTIDDSDDVTAKPCPNKAVVKKPECPSTNAPVGYVWSHDDSDDSENFSLPSFYGQAGQTIGKIKREYADDEVATDETVKCSKRQKTRPASASQKQHQCAGHYTTRDYSNPTSLLGPIHRLTHALVSADEDRAAVQQRSDQAAKHDKVSKTMGGIGE